MNNYSNAQPAELAARIRGAFVDAPHPGDRNLVYDTSGTHLECNQVERAFTSRKWFDLEPGFLSRNDNALYFFSPAALRYFLPAFMLLSIEEPHNSRMVPLALASVLSPTTQAGGSRRLETLRLACSSEEQDAISAFLRFLSKAHEGDFAGTHHLQDAVAYWHRDSS